MADIFLHPLHVRERLAWDFNWLTRHQVGDGLWQQNWTHEGRMQEPAEGLNVAVSRWEIVPAIAMPSDRVVVAIEEEGSCIWLIREGYCTHALRDAMNVMLERIAGDGLWLQYWYECRWRRSAQALGPALPSPSLALPA
ncbi:hypothetical protein [Streptomyces sp. NPDC047070]|uniref:hypothetical protein n=1 Tax=Streptomyces sp. NPDC047070 TaxID=3154923 RepID=UPI003453146D